MSQSRKHRVILSLGRKKSGAAETREKRHQTLKPAITQSDFPRFEQRLRTRWQVLREEIHDTLLRADAERYAAIADQVHDSKDQALADLLVGVSHAEISRDVEEVRDIELALKRIATGTYGTCLQCHSPIPQKRLEAYPSAKRCLSCQQLHERARSRPAP